MPDIKRIQNLMDVELGHLVEESKAAGFRFVERLVDEYKSGANRFDQPAECLYGVFDDQGLVIAVCGLNRDPYAAGQRAGRLRRFYVVRDWRRRGIGQRLLEHMVAEAQLHYDAVVLHTDTEPAAAFYRAMGFVRTDAFPQSTHVLPLR